jgi:hypothetical protein
MDVSFFQEMLSRISERGRQILDLPSLITVGGQETFESLCKALVSSRGEASGVALARRVPPGKSFSAASILRRTEPRTWFTCGRTSLRG